MKTARKIFTAGIVAGLASGIMIPLSANVDLGSQQQGTPLQGIHPWEYGSPYERGRHAGGAEARSREYRRLAEQRQREHAIEFGARPERVEEHNLYEFSNVEGMRVENREGRELGSVEDLAIDVDTGWIDFIVVSTEGATEPGELKAVPVQSLDARPEAETLILDIDERRWAQAPSIQREQIADLADPQRQHALARHYGVAQTPHVFGAPPRRDEGPQFRRWMVPEERAVPPATPPSPDEPREFGAPRRPASPGPEADIDARTERERERTAAERRETEWAERAEPRMRTEYGTRARARADEGPRVRNPRHQNLARGSLRSPSPVLREAVQEGRAEQFRAEQEPGRVYGAREREREREWRDRPARAHRDNIKAASELVGTEVQANGGSFGEISDFMVALPQGQVQFVIIGERDAPDAERYAVPIGDLQTDVEPRFALRLSPDQLRAAPELDQQAAVRADRIYRYVDPDAREFAAPDREREEARPGMEDEPAPLDERTDEPALDQPDDREDWDRETGPGDR